MKTDNKTLISIVNEMLDNFEKAERTDKSIYYRTKKDVEWQKDIIFKAHLDRMPCDDIYDRIHTILCDLSDLDEKSTEDDMRYRVYEIEPDCYTFDLTSWLNSDNRNVYYLEEALEIDCKDGFQLLAYAQSTYIEEIGNELINGIVERLEELKD